MNILVIAPHPDDEILGCGGTILKMTSKGHNVDVCIVTKGQSPQFDSEYIERGYYEDFRANLSLGVSKIFSLKFPASNLDMIPQYQINDSIKDVIEEIEPEEIYIPYYGDIHHDHKIVAEAAMVAARPMKGQCVKRIYAYEVPSETGWDVPDNTFKPNVYIDITNQIQCKVEAFQLLKTQKKKYPDARSAEVLYSIAQYRGSQVGYYHAEAFMLLRELK